MTESVPVLTARFQLVRWARPTSSQVFVTLTCTSPSINWDWEFSYKKGDWHMNNSIIHDETVKLQLATMVHSEPALLAVMQLEHGWES